MLSCSPVLVAHGQIPARRDCILTKGDIAQLRLTSIHSRQADGSSGPSWSRMGHSADTIRQSGNQPSLVVGSHREVINQSIPIHDNS